MVMFWKVIYRATNIALIQESHTIQQNAWLFLYISASVMIFDHHYCARPLVSGGLESLVGRAVQGCCVVHIVVVVDPSFCVGWLWSWSKYLMLVAAVFRLLVLLDNIPLLYTLNSPTRWRTLHSSKTCCWVSVWLPHALHVCVWCLFLKLFIYWEHYWSGFEDGAGLGPC